MSTTTSTRPLAPPVLTDGRRAAVRIIADQLWRPYGAWKDDGDAKRCEVAARVAFAKWRSNRTGDLKNRCPGRIRP